jgi:RNA polymerase sigma-70 factor (ECF subfamily)
MDQKGHLIFEEVLAQNSDRLWRLSRVYALDDQDAKDLYQEIAIHIWKGIQTYQAKSSVNTWIYRIAINTAINHKIQSGRRKSHLPLSEDMIISTFEARHPQAERLYDYIKKLNDVDRSLITLYLEDFSHREIAEVLGISENYVAVKLGRIRDKLSIYLKNEKNG